MSSAPRKKPRRSAAPPAAAGSRPPAAPKKRAKNLSLRPEDIAHGEAYSRRHGTRLSTLVGEFLRALPLDPGPARALAPAVRRLYGVAVGASRNVQAREQAGMDHYRAHLHRKYTGS